jgi:hypothetical protein
LLVRRGVGWPNVVRSYLERERMVGPHLEWSNVVGPNMERCRLVGGELGRVGRALCPDV